MLNEKRWHRLLAALGQKEYHPNVYAEIMAAYAGPNRHYHNVDHITHCLAEYDICRHLALNAEEVEFAIWLHDAVYDPQAKDNEKKSAQWAARILASLGCRESVIDRISRLIMATQHHQTSSGVDTQLLLDVDLSILGQPQADFDKYEKQVRKEYKWVPWLVYCIGRKKVLKSFLEKPAIYQTPPFIEKYEHQARQNITRSMRQL